MGSVCSMVFQGNGLMGSASVIGENQTNIGIVFGCCSNMILETTHSEQL